MLTVTEIARQKFTDILEKQQQIGWPIRLSVIGRGIDSFAYDLVSVRPDSRRPDDRVIEADDLTFLVDSESAPNLEGSVVDYNTEKKGFQVDNPNTVWTDDLGREVARLIIEEVNPGIAGHGGAILPVDVRDNVVYIRMFGGCQGCGMANATLTLGVEKTLKEALPQIQQVVDITHHAGGTNPYYASTEKGQTPAATN
jgi:Fe/S biogenesis protein NfuA